MLFLVVSTSTASRRFPATTAFVASRIGRRSRPWAGRFFSSTTDNTNIDPSVPSPPQQQETFFSSDVTSFETLVQSPVLLQRLTAQNLVRPTSVQAAAYDSLAKGVQNVTVGAETGSGKTLAYLVPLMDDILQHRTAVNANADMSPAKSVDDSDDEYETDGDNAISDNDTTTDRRSSYDYARALILVPNKELVQQVVRMALPLAGGPKALVFGRSSDDSSSSQGDDHASSDADDIIRIAVMPGGLKSPLDFQAFRNTKALSPRGTTPPIDLVISTPAAVGPLALSPKNIDMFADISTLIIDEADMLLDGGYLRALENVLMGFRRADRLDRSVTGVLPTQHVFVAATLPDYGLRSVDAFLRKKFPHADRVHMEGMHNARHSGLAVPTVWSELESKKERMLQLVELLQRSPNVVEEKGSGNGGVVAGLKGQKVMVFLNSVDDVENASEALQRADVNCIPYHAKIRLDERVKLLDRFRRYDATKANNNDKEDDSVPVLVCTDLASRGLDVPGVNVVVQLQFAGNVVSHLHRMGRCGRAGHRTGRGIVFFGEKERDLVEVVREAESVQERLSLPGDVLESLTEDSDEDDDTSLEDASNAGNVRQAFSRKRGFTKKRKKERARENESDDTMTQEYSQ